MDKVSEIEQALDGAQREFDEFEANKAVNPVYTPSEVILYTNHRAWLRELLPVVKAARALMVSGHGSVRTMDVRRMTVDETAYKALEDALGKLEAASQHAGEGSE